MIKYKFKKVKGVSLVSLTIAVVVLMILANIVIYNAKDNLKVGNLKEMQNDISNLRDKVSSYYAQNGKIPASLVYSNNEAIEKIKEVGVISEKVDIGNFLVIDLTALDNLTLNRGEDYKKIKEIQNPTTEQVNQYTDLYIINETSHNIFYVQGIKLDNEIFYTDYTAETVDKKAVNLKYVDNVKIPEGFYYVGGTKDTGLVISDVEGDDLDNTKQGNQFVWVPVENIKNFVRIEGYSNGSQQSLTSYTEPFDDGYSSETSEYDAMKNSVQSNHGFYIGRYEAGKDSLENVVVKKGANVYNNVPWGNAMNDIEGTSNTGGKVGAVKLAKEFATNNHYQGLTSTLCYDVQWDATLKFIDSDYTGFAKDSSKKGWYSDNYNKTDSGNKEINPNHIIGKDLIYDDSPNVIANKQKNIYDMAGNVWEWTLGAYGTLSRAGRGGNFEYDGTEMPASYQGSNLPSLILDRIGFRIALYLSVEDKWSQPYDQEAVYQDKNGDTAYIPKGFQVSEKGGENTIDEGLVVKDSEENEWVWIEVPKSIYQSAESSEDYEAIEQDMINYAKDYREEGYEDKWYSEAQFGLTQTQYNELKNSMLKSVYEKGGFYIGRYETGTETARKLVTDTLTDPLIKQNRYPYTMVTATQAMSLSKQLQPEGKITSLIFGIQWDLVMKNLEEKETKLGTTNSERQSKIKKTTYDLVSSDWGNYSNVGFTVARGEYAVLNTTSYQLGDWNAINNTKKSKDKSILLTTGATDRNSALNIYDLAGNVWEWTLEYTGTANINTSMTNRGGGYNNQGSNYPISMRNNSSVSTSTHNCGFRVALY